MNVGVQLLMDRLLKSYDAAELSLAVESDLQPGICKGCLEVTDRVPAGSDHNDCEHCDDREVVSLGYLVNKGAYVDL